MRTAASALFCLAILFGSTIAHAIVVERVVAVVGDRPVLLSELRHRTKPRLTLLALRSLQQGAPVSNLPMQLVAAEPKAASETLDDMIAERLFEQQAERAHLSISVDDVNRSIRNKAEQLSMTEAELLQLASMQGYSTQDYRDEVRRQLLEGKLLQLRLANRIDVTEEDARRMYERHVATAPIELGIISLRVTSGAKMTLAQSIVDQARSGTPWCELSQSFNEDTETKDTCGSRGRMTVDAIQVEAVRDAAMSMREGDVGDPIPVGHEAILVIKLLHRDRLPPYAQMRQQMLDEALEEAILKQRGEWIRDLRRHVYVDIKL